jgi:leucyl-tRNA synthetase
MKPLRIAPDLYRKGDRDAAYDAHDVEARWQAEWERAGCHLAPDVPSGDKFFVHDSTPFPNGPLHMGHVRTYVLGDVTARYQRLLGKCVLYHTGFDSFGLPIELEAQQQGIAPGVLVRRSIAEQTRQLKRLGISYDWSRVADTSDPQTYRWTQWLFLEMVEAGLVERRDAPLNWCPRCETTLARLQVEDGRCWRCGTRVETRKFPQWCISISRYARRLRRSLDDLTEWSERSKRTLAGILDDRPVEGQGRGQGGVDWLVSRQRSWGTPIPMVHCEHCGAVPVRASDLPVILPDTVDWASGSGALSRCEEFVRTSCPDCGGPAMRETDTLDCGFDDAWCFFQTLVLHGASPGFTRENLNRWQPVDRCQSGRDTFTWFHLYRFLGVFLHERGLIDDADYIRSFVGHDMVLADGQKMSKHLGNAVNPDAILETYGADALRVAMMWAAGPQRSFYWRQEHLEKAARFLGDVYAIYQRASELSTQSAPGPRSGGTRRALALVREARHTIARVAKFIEEYRPNAGVEALANLLPRIEVFAARRAESGRHDPTDGTLLQGILDDYAVALAPFAPHLAEQIWCMRGHRSLVAQARWPTPPTRRRRSDRSSARPPSCSGATGISIRSRTGWASCRRC